jgi:hypothetical protein
MKVQLGGKEFASNLKCPRFESRLSHFFYQLSAAGGVEEAGLTLYHPHVAVDGGVRFSQLGAKSLNLILSGQQMSAQLYCHILVVYHLHPWNIVLHPVGLELILLPVG